MREALTHYGASASATPFIGDQPDDMKAAPTFSDHFSQATQFWNSMSDWEKDHIAAAFSFELNQVVNEGVRDRTMNEILVNIDETLANLVSEATGIPVNPAGTPEAPTPSAPTPSGPLHKDAAKLRSPALSQDKQPPPTTLLGRKVAVLLGNGVNAREVQAILAGLASAGLVPSAQWFGQSGMASQSGLRYGPAALRRTMHAP